MPRTTGGPSDRSWQIGKVASGPRCSPRPTWSFIIWVPSVVLTPDLALRCPERIPDNATLVPVVDGNPDDALLFGHDEIVRLAVTVLRRQYSQEIDPAGLLVLQG